jgi:predicted AlkP superfamily phosphohydrolase/phosphomutase
MSDNQVVLIGLDGLGLHEVGEWVDDGSLSVLQRLRSDGTAADLESTIPPWTPCAWPSLTTGRNPGEHGVFDFFVRDGYEKSLLDRSDVDAPYLWEVADAYGLTALSVNFPATHPVTKLEHGAVVPGYLAPENAPFHPAGLREDFESRFGPYKIYPDTDDYDDPVEGYTRAAKCRRDVATLLDERYDWDLLAVQFQVTDSVFHDLEDRDAIHRVLERVDTYVEDVLALSDDDPTVFVVSDHGMGDYEWKFYVNSWLADRGYCRLTEGAPDYFRARKDQLKGQTETEEDGPTLLARSVNGVVAALSRVGVTPRDVHRTLKHLNFDGPVERLLPAEAVADVQNQTVDWPRSQAYQILFNSLGLHLNVAGREPSGTVPRDEYDDFRDELIAELSAVTDPDGANVFDRVLPREEVYHGSNVERAPDVVLVPRDYEYDVSGSIVDTYQRKTHKNHKPDGVFFTNRRPSRGADFDRASIYDVAPTVAACLGIPVDAATDGHVLPVATSEREEPWQAVTESVSLGGEGADTDETVEDHLRQLGYME